VTIVFCDLKGSTSMAERLDSESLREVMTRYFAEMRGALERHGGRVEKYIGDAVMAVFGLPKLHEDDALRAVRAAAEMRERLVALNDELDRLWGVRLANRTGVNTGEVVAGDPGALERLVVGDAVNVAARLEQAAPTMGILIGDSTYRLVRDAVDVESVEPLELKGKSGPTRAYLLHGLRAVDAQAAQHDLPLVGREEELARALEAFAATLTDRRPRLLIVVGDAGVGKSRLVAELMRIVSAEATVLRGRCLPYGQGITFWPLREVVRNAAGVYEEASFDEVRRSLPAFDDDERAYARLASAIGLSADQFPVEEIFWAARKLFSALAQRAPLVIIIDDVHWAEPTFLDLVEHLVDDTEDAPLLVVCSARQELSETRPEWESRAGADRIALEPLSDADADEIVTNLLGHAGIDEAARARIVAAAMGNPFYVEQLLSMLIDDGLLRLQDGVWSTSSDLSELAVPPTINALLAARLDRLLDDQRAVIEPAAVAGVVFPRAGVEELVDAALRPAIGRHLLALTQKQLVRPDTPSPDEEERFRFQHVLIRDAAYNGLLKRARATLHERFAAWVQRVSGGSIEYEEILGYHLEQAYRFLADLGPLDADGIELGVRAAERLGAAGQRAFARGDMAAAAGLLRRAAALLPEIAPPRLALLPNLGEALLEMGEFAEAERVLADALDGATVAGDEQVAAEARLVRLLVARYTADARGWADAVKEETSRSLPFLEAAGDHVGLCRAWRLRFYVHAAASRTADAAAAATQIIEYAALAGDRRREGIGAMSYATASLYGPTPVSEAIAECERIVNQGLGDRQAEGLVLCALAYLYAMEGDSTRARQCHERALAVLEDVGKRVLAAAAAVESWGVEMLAGEPAAAEARLRRDYEILERMGEKLYLPTVAALLGQAIYSQGRYEEARALAEVARVQAPKDDVDAQALWRSLLAKVLACEERSVEAEELAREAVATLEASDAIVMQADALADLAEVLRLGGRLEEAGAVLRQAAELYGRKGNCVSAARAALLIEEVGSSSASP
jgi:class 3 adenylate cyclase/tetratricopeptide (TPR) repeat protein